MSEQAKHAWLIRAWFFWLLLILSDSRLAAQTRSNVLEPAVDPRGAAELVVCSQNLALYGSFADMRAKKPALTRVDYDIKEEALLERFIKARCDVIAVQEVLGKDDAAALKALQFLAAGLKNKTNRFFETQIGASNDQNMRNGFLVAKDRAEIVNSVSYAKVELPKLMEDQRPHLFPRGPLEIQLEVKPRGESIAKTVTLITFHFKSRAGGAADYSGLEFETSRMEMAEALRRIVENRHAQSFASGETLLVLLGDRNSNFDTASAKILEGVLVLKNFQEQGPCRLSKRGMPLCQAGTASTQRLFSVLTTDPQVKLLPGTFRKDKVYSWLDDIIMPLESLRFALEDPFKEGKYASSVVYNPKAASDHALVYVKLNW